LEEAVVRSAIAQALRGTGHVETRLRLTLAPPRLFVSAESFAPLPHSFYELGVRCATVPLSRQNPKAKDTRFVSVAERAYHALPPDVHEGLLVSENAILEGLSSNFFACHEGTLRTEEDRALDGVTRSMVLEIATSVVPVLREAIRLEELPRVSESFLTSVSRGILPVVAVDGGRIGSGRPGPLVSRLSTLFDELVQREAEAVD
jgi:branched-subunit amino acid aminotransferase/4-amino-4-deoxychorismate lyase